MARDYYDVLGISREASGEQIKRAFRRKAKQNHPDANPGDANAEARFKELNEAYEVLSDDDKRAAYDRFGDNWQHYQNINGGNPFSSGGDIPFTDMSDIFETIFAGSGGRRRARALAINRQPISRVPAGILSRMSISACVKPTWARSASSAKTVVTSACESRAAPAPARRCGWRAKGIPATTAARPGICIWSFKSAMIHSSSAWMTIFTSMSKLMP